MRKHFSTILSNGIETSGTAGTPYPNPADGGLYVGQHYVSEGVSACFRGLLPGFYPVPQAVPDGVFNNGDAVASVSGLTGKSLRAMVCRQDAPHGICFFDVTGPWR